MIVAVASVFALFVSGALAECPNACSGQGDCDTKDQCNCYVGYYGGDCSLRVCPVGTAFVDTPLGDLDHNGAVSPSSYSKVQWSQYKQPEVWPTSAALGGFAAQPGETHFAVECSGKGSCDRALGVCECYDGFTGAACQRTTCPNSCSGHGICYTVGEIASKALNSKLVQSAYGESIYSGISKSVDYKLWDSDKNQACVCDPGYSGIDCSLRSCPRGDDPLTTLPYTCGLSACRNEIQSFSIDGGQDKGGAYSLVFTDLDGNSFETDVFKLITDTSSDDYDAASNEEAIKQAIEALPNNVAGVVDVATAIAPAGTDNAFSYSVGGSTGEEQLRFSVEFTTKSGDIPDMKLKFRRDVEEDTGASFIFQPGMPVQNLVLEKVASSTQDEYVQVKIFPMDPTLYSLDDYWTSEMINLKKIQGDAAALSHMATAMATALNSIPAIKLTYGAPFVADGTVIAVFNSTNGGRVTFKIAFPDKNTGYNAVQFRRGVGTTSPADPPLLDSVAWDTVEIPILDNVDGNKEAAVCANRGLCDYSTGLCSCFAGHTGVDCSQQSALARGSVSGSGSVNV